MATIEGTARYAKSFEDKNFSDPVFRFFGSTGLTVSCLGFGGYRVFAGSKINRSALIKALSGGVNLIDTSSNYMDGESEGLFGEVLEELSNEKKLSRDEIILVTKAGYVQGKTLKNAQKLEAENKAFPDMVKYMKDVWHCIHPDFLEDQLKRSLKRLKTDYIDVFLLHNPEYFLYEAKNKGIEDIEAVRDEYYRRIALAFEWLEEKTAAGKIGCYGVSSNTLAYKSTEVEFTSLEKLLQIAGNISADNSFKVIQFPFNIIEAGAVIELNQSENSKTLLNLAAEFSLAVMVNRPLNAMSGNSLVRLASFEETNPGIIRQDFDNYIDRLSRLEKRFSKEFLSLMPREIPNEAFLQAFSFSQKLSNAMEEFEDRENWDHAKNNLILSQTVYFFNYLKTRIKDNNDLIEWMADYSRSLKQFLEAVTKHYENIAEKRSAKISEILIKLNEDLNSSSTLSQKALRVNTSIPGIHTVLVGMRQKKYVNDALAIFSEPPVQNAALIPGKIIIPEKPKEQSEGMNSCS